MLKKRNQKGFTLIEIIAVLVILGILAAVAIPKYMDMQQEARAKAVMGATSALQSAATMSYSRQLLNGEANASAWNASRANGNVGDYYGTIAGQNPVVVTVTGPASLTNGSNATTNSKNFPMW